MKPFNDNNAYTALITASTAQYIAMATTVDQYVENNKSYASRRPNVQLSVKPSKRTAIISCMESRIVLESQLGVREGESHVIRNGGGRVQEAIRSLLVSQQMLGTREIMLIQHTDCGFQSFTSQDAKKKIREQIDITDDSSDGAKILESLDFLEFTDEIETLKADAEYLRAHPLINVRAPPRMKINFMR
jgi:carbonic anhydrase